MAIREIPECLKEFFKNLPEPGTRKSLELPEKLQKIFEKLPESGMGYHLVEVHFTNGIIRTGLVVINCRWLKDVDDYDLEFTLDEIVSINVSVLLCREG